MLKKSAPFLHYFAYGSNLHPVRIVERIPSAKALGAVEVNDFKLVFHKQSRDGSGKCNLIKTNSGSIHGVIYQIQPQHKKDLDRFEDLGKGYRDVAVDLTFNNQPIQCFMYIAQNAYIRDDLHPYDWYQKLVLLGAKYHQFPELYLNKIKTIKSKPDPDSNRTREMSLLISRITQHK